MVERKNLRNHEFTVLIEQDEDGYYVATVPALKSCYTQAKTMEELYPRIREVIKLCLEEEKPVLMKFIGLQQVKVEAGKTL
ncbi:type II toxin-antitoxin system HicB family antitoxin [bacterium]|nr:type II toxin-antitoxin system HicB family antitoxin [bacterium]MBU0900320.1 type II toxin-antitoxin system HicB family antitoxin [bacterium]MBU1153348.1 type II toxin-antitoxin system HicB family antitoxin [bacterium]MBU1782284.1 type II toxin-antitoxin system HicB family antitoxin [bacterium]MBU2599373.1 type II toxin-antitoxin system HicB family antitoxin [bacterium]